MRKILTILLSLSCLAAAGQTKKTLRVLTATKLLVRTIFETKDSSTLEKLFAPGMIHQAADGRTETREEAIRNFAGNKSDFAQADMKPGYGVVHEGDSSVVRYFYKGRELKPDGSTPVYTVNLVMVWMAKKKEPKLFRLQTIRVE